MHLFTLFIATLMSFTESVVPRTLESTEFVLASDMEMKLIFTANQKIRMFCHI